jgi:hypothetical protein
VPRLGSLVVCLCLATSLPAQQRASTRTEAPTARTTLSQRARDSIAEDSATRAFLQRDEAAFLARLEEKRTQLLTRAAWADLGDRCDPGALRVYPVDTTQAQQAETRKLIASMEQTIVGRGAGARLDTPAAAQLIRVIVGWEAGVDRPQWDVLSGMPRRAFAAGLTGEVPDPRGSGCLPSPVQRDTVTFVLPGYTTMEFPRAPTPRVKAYFGPHALQHARDEFFKSSTGDLSKELSYVVVAPVVIWRGWALVGVDRPRERGGVEVGVHSDGGAVYMLRQNGASWRLVAVVRSWGGPGGTSGL